LRYHRTGDVLDCKSGVALCFPPHSIIAPELFRDCQISCPRHGLRRQSAAAPALSSARIAWKFHPVQCVRKRCRASLATAVQNGAFHDSHSFLIAAFSAAFFSAKEGSLSAISVARQASRKNKFGFILIENFSQPRLTALYCGVFQFIGEAFQVIHRNNKTLFP
jgi:hypothetical protein